MRRVSTSEARKELAELINRVAYAQDRVLIGRRGKELAALIPIADLRLLERLADDLEDRWTPRTRYGLRRTRATRACPGS